MVSDDLPGLSPYDLASAMVNAARKLGLEGTFLRIAAEELPDSGWTVHTETDTAGRGVMATAAHACVTDCCPADGKCLTALKVEQVVSRERGRPYVIASVRLRSRKLLVRLKPLE
jgi:hypothetical protein